MYCRPFPGGGGIGNVCVCLILRSGDPNYLLQGKVKLLIADVRTISSRPTCGLHGEESSCIELKCWNQTQQCVAKKRGVFAGDSVIESRSSFKCV